MKIWIDHQLSPNLTGWLRERFELHVEHVRDLGLHEADDADIFTAAREADVVVMTKDRDFVDLVDRRGVPPQVLWVTCGNTSNAALKDLFDQTLDAALNLLSRGEPLVEISDAAGPPGSASGTRSS